MRCSPTATSFFHSQKVVLRNTGGNTYAQLLGNSQRLNGYNQLEEECGK